MTLLAAAVAEIVAYFDPANLLGPVVVLTPLAILALGATQAATIVALVISVLLVAAKRREVSELRRILDARADDAPGLRPDAAREVENLSTRLRICLDRRRAESARVGEREVRLRETADALQREVHALRREAEVLRSRLERRTSPPTSAASPLAPRD